MVLFTNGNSLTGTIGSSNQLIAKENNWEDKEASSIHTQPPQKEEEHVKLHTNGKGSHNDSAAILLLPQVHDVPFVLANPQRVRVLANPLQPQKEGEKVEEHPQKVHEGEQDLV